MITSTQADTTTTVRPNYLIPLFILLNLPLFSASVQSNSITFYSLICVNILCTIAGVLTYNRVRFFEPSINLSFSLPIFIQASVQLSVFVYVILMGFGNSMISLVQSRMPLIGYQIIFAFVFEYLLTCFREKAYRPGLYVLPMVFSLNLFLWFVGDYFVFQLLLIVVAILIKTFIVRVNEDGRVSHIFNPSFIALTICILAIFLFYDQLYPSVIDSAMISFYESTPAFDIFMLCVGCITLWRPNSYLISFGAYSTIMFLNALTLHFSGHILFLGLVRGAVLITILLGVTDPATSPRTKIGKFLFGVSYGLLLTLISLIVFTLGLYKFGTFLKILPVPILNMYARKFDHLITPKLSVNFMDDYYISRLVSILVFGIVFNLTYQQLEASIDYPFFLQIVANNIRAELGFQY